MAYRQFAYYYDRLMADMPYPEWLLFAKQGWDRYGLPSTVVDLGCGTGNIAIPLAESGYKVIGIDLSEDMLSIANEKSARLQQVETVHRVVPHGQGSVTWVQQDIRQWELVEPVDAVISFCDCFNYLLEETEIIQAFTQTFQGLKPGGTFIFDVHTTNQLRDYADAQPFHLNEDEIAYIWTCELDEDRYEIEHHLTIFVAEDLDDHNPEASQARFAVKKFSRIEETHVQRAYSLDWLQQMLVQVGFHDVECFGDFLWKPVTEATQRAFFIAHKN